MFVDRATINVKAGNGGKGCESFHLQRGERFRRRDGGDGGKGGDIIIKADPNVNTLLDFRYHQHFKAKSGKHGSSNLKKGADGDNCIILVPLGTIISDEETGYRIRDLNKETEHVIVAYGGAGGLGNGKKREVTQSEPGQEKRIRLDLKLIADVGLVGYPNAGKSSFLNVISAAKSKVAQFPFTTLSPMLGVVTSSNCDNRFVVADIPGLIKDAHKGKGLGFDFLRHIERTKILLFIIDMSGCEGRDPCEDYGNLLNEIELYDGRLLKRPQLIVANKMDLPESAANLKRFKKTVKENIFEVSCVLVTGIEKTVKALHEMIFHEVKDNS